LVSTVLTSSALIAGDLTEMAGDGVGGSFFIEPERLGIVLNMIVWERTGTAGRRSFLDALVLKDSRFDIDLRLTGGRGVTSAGSSFVFVTHQPPDLFSCIFRCAILRESVFPLYYLFSLSITLYHSYSQLMLVIATLYFFHVHLYFPPCTSAMTFFTSSNLALAKSPI